MIDWRNATEGSPDLDVALSAVIVAQTAVCDRRRIASARALLAAFLDNAEAEPSRMLDRALAIRGGDPNLTACEVDQLTSAGALVREYV